MAANSYNPYNYPYQQSTAQQYSTYQTAPASSNISQSSRQYQPAPPVVTQSTDYMSYQAQAYGGQGNAYGGAQDDSWSGNNYGGSRDTTRGAAEALRNMSNTSYTPNSTTAMSQPGFTATNASAAPRYSSNTPQGQQAYQPPAHAYGQTQARPRSVNTNRSQGSSLNRGLPSPATATGYPSQRTGTTYNQNPQRSNSPAQAQYMSSNQVPATSARSAAMTAATQYNEYSHRQLPHLDATRSGTAPASTSYAYGDVPAAAPIGQSNANNVAETFNQGAITVDPMAVYDPWPEYQRKQEALRAQKAVEDAARAEEEKREEEARKEEEQRKEEERKQQEEEERVRSANMNKSKQKGKKSQQPNASDANAAQASFPGDAMEFEIRALMSKMREFNSKDPAMLARIWEEERRAKAPKSPAVQNNATPQAATAISPSQPSAPQAANQRRKAAPKDKPAPTTAKPATPVVAQATMGPPAPAAAAPSRAGGKTVWPAEKKPELAVAAAKYLNAQNPNRPMESGEVLRMLNGNPSYIELCEQLENMGLRLDRAGFAKNLLTAVPDVNSASRQAKPIAGPVNGVVSAKTQVAPPAVMKRDPGTPATPAANFASAAPSPYPTFSGDTAATPVPMAEMIPIKAELKPPANKEEAARKRNFNDLIDLTQLPEDEEFEPPPKKTNIGSMYSYGSPSPAVPDAMDVDKGSSANFPIPARATPHSVQDSAPTPPVNELRYTTIIEPLDRRKALRRNKYNIKTIARDVLLACGRHPETRQLNQHLDLLRTTLPQVTYESDLSTLKWDLIDPGRPPPGYFKDSVQGLAEDADDEEDSDEERKEPPRRTSMQGEGTDHSRVQAFSEAINPFKQKRRGRPPRHSFPETSTTPSTPKRSNSTSMSATAPRPATSGVGYAAFRPVTEYDADGKPVPKKRGRPVGWRKNIHGSAEAQARPSANKYTGPNRFTPSQPSTLRNVQTGDKEPIRIDSRSPSVANKVPRYQAFKCKWDNCKAELHNLDTLKKHVNKVHQKQNTNGTLECLWANCATQVASHDTMTNMRIEKFEPKTFTSESEWQDHIEHAHLSPLSWQLGDGPASGLSDANDSEAYLSDAQGRRVTPRITPRPEYLEDKHDINTASAFTKPSPAPRGRGRPPKIQLEQKAREVQDRLISQKKRVGGPGMDRGGATLVNDKRRKGFSDNDETEEELVDAEG